MIYHLDVLKWAATYSGPKYHAALLDPPYELNFMNKGWDNTGIAFRPETWAALAEHLHDGAFCMAFAGTRGYHRMACAIEDAGFIIHPAIGWAFSTGFPKATRIDTQIDKAAGAEQQYGGQYIAPDGKPRGVDLGIQNNSFGAGNSNYQTEKLIKLPSTKLAKTWAQHRYGLQALKPAFEFIAIAQKPYNGRPVDSITTTGAGALWIDGGRVGTDTSRGDRYNGKPPLGGGNLTHQGRNSKPWDVPVGRWPSNLILQHSPDCVKVGTKKVKTNWSQPTEGKHDGLFLSHSNNQTGKPVGYTDKDGYEIIEEWQCNDNCPVKMLGEQSGETGNSARLNSVGNVYENNNQVYGKYNSREHNSTHDDSGTAARFFYQASWEYEIAEQLANADPIKYVAKASRTEREAGLEGFELNQGLADYEGFTNHPRPTKNTMVRNSHPTVKPISLTKYLATLLLPPIEYAPRRMVIPFCGVGSEMIGATLAGWDEVDGIEMMPLPDEPISKTNPDYVGICEARLAWWSQWPGWGQTDVEVILSTVSEEDGQLSMF